MTAQQLKVGDFVRSEGLIWKVLAVRARTRHVILANNGKPQRRVLSFDAVVETTVVPGARRRRASA